MRQPVAIDLRPIISGLKIAAEMERIADYAANIAKNVANLNQVSLEKPVGLIMRMAAVAQQMLQDVVEAYWGWTWIKRFSSGIVMSRLTGFTPIYYPSCECTCPLILITLKLTPA